MRESNPPVRAAAGLRYSVFIDGEGRLSSCGSATDDIPGLLGHGEGVTRLNTPTRLPSTLGGERAVSVSAGLAHILALAADSSIWSWGGGAFAFFGQLGHGDTQNQWLPKKIEAFAGQRVVAVSAGPFHSFAVTADGAVWSWGSGASGQLGHGDEEPLLPKKVEALAGQRVVAVAAGSEHSFALAADGAVWSWGCGDHGRLGHGDRQRQLLPKKVEALAGQRVVAVSAGFEHSFALTADGAAWSWGDRDCRLRWDGAAWSWSDGDYGRLGHGDEQGQLLPKKIEAFAGQRVVAVSAGEQHSIARTADGAVFTLGEGGHGCLGHGEDLSDQLLPKKVEVWA